MAELNIKFETEWRKEGPTAEPCFACKEPVYSQMNVRYTTLNGKIVGPGVVLCESCYELLNKEE